MSINFNKFFKRKTNVKDLFLVAGPCSAETESQIMQTAIELSKYEISVFRAGIWKPRTHPNSFEGVGTIGLKWLKNASIETNLPVAVEVATPHHIEECLKNEIDILWIGSRTTANPFSVQSIANSLKSVDIPIMVKNPINPDIELWIGAFERLSDAGIRRMIAIHRGFSNSNEKEYRNDPNWILPIEFRKRMTSVPVICDPSHICGRKETLVSIAQKALDLLFDGLMIEVHNNPLNALSDSLQQLTPKEYCNFIQLLRIGNDITSNTNFENNLEYTRIKIDEIDNEIIYLIRQRMKYVKKLGELIKGK